MSSVIVTSSTVQGSRRGADICTAQAARTPTMAGVTLGGSLGITVQVCNGAARYVTHSLPPSLADLWKRTIRPRSHRRVSTAFRAHRGRSKAVVARARVPLLHIALRHRVCTTKIAECVDRGGSPGHIWWACRRQGEGTTCRGSDQPRWQVDTGLYGC